jgi:ribosomal protein L3
MIELMCAQNSTAAASLAHVNDITIGKFQVFKNRKMPGPMGGEQRTVKNVSVYQIDPARNLLHLKGQVLISDVTMDFVQSYK